MAEAHEERPQIPSEAKGKEPLCAVANVRLTSAEKERLREEADLSGMSLSELVRRRCLGRRVQARVDLAVIKELRRLGGLLKHLHNESGGAHSQESAAALRALQSYLEKLSR